MPSAVVTNCSYTPGYVMTIIPASGRPISNRRCGDTPAEAAAELANAMIRHHVYKRFVAAPPEVMEHIERLCPGPRMR